MLDAAAARWLYRSAQPQDRADAVGMKKYAAAALLVAASLPRAAGAQVSHAPQTPPVPQAQAADAASKPQAGKAAPPASGSQAAPQPHQSGKTPAKQTARPQAAKVATPKQEAAKQEAAKPEAQAAPAPTQAVSLAIAVPGAPAPALAKFLLAPFTETGAALHSQASATAETAPPDHLLAAKPDLALLTGAQLAAGCKAQTLRKLDWDRLGRGRFLPDAASDCGAGAWQQTAVLAWDPAKLTTPPGWGDFWDVARHPGRRGLPQSARLTLEPALLADGVSPGDIYRTLRSQEGQDRAFRKLDQLKPYLVWWNDAAEAASALASGKVLITEAPADAVLKLDSPAHRFGLQWQQSITAWRSWAIPRDAASADLALLAIEIATDPARQAGFAKATMLAPASRGAAALLAPNPNPAPNPVADLTLAPPASAALAVDDGFWAENGARLEDRFAHWLNPDEHAQPH